MQQKFACPTHISLKIELDAKMMFKLYFKNINFYIF